MDPVSRGSGSINASDESPKCLINAIGTGDAFLERLVCVRFFGVLESPRRRTFILGMHTIMFAFNKSEQTSCLEFPKDSPQNVMHHYKRDWSNKSENAFE